VRYAGFWRRVLAVVIDLILLAPAIEFGKEFFYLTVWRWDERGTVELADRLTPSEDRETSMIRMRQIADFGALIFLLAAPYYVLTESSALQGTLGKRLLGLRVTDLDGRRIRFGRSLLRYLARLLSALPWQLGFVMAGFTSKKQALHDILAKTVVQVADHTEETEVDVWQGSGKTSCSTCLEELPRGAAFCSLCGTARAYRPKTMQYAGFGRKAVALLVDLVIVTLMLVVLLNRFPPVSQQEFQRFQRYSGDQVSLAERQDLQTTIFLRGSYLFALVFFVSGLYCVFLESSALRGTLGKRALGLRVTDEAGARIGVGRALGRFVVHSLSLWMWLVGFVMAAFTDKRQALHDILAGTVVIVASKQVTE